MRPVRCDWMETVYRGTTPDVGDLWCHRPQRGEVWACYELEEGELELLLKGGRVVLRVMTEPLPPVGLGVFPEEETRPVGTHPYKVIPELEDPERIPATNYAQDEVDRLDQEVPPDEK